MQILLIAGMHRSGTSCVAAELANAGLKISDNLLPADEGNAKGYFEDPALIALHDEILQSIASNWMDPSPLPTNWINRLMVGGYGHKIASYLDRFGSVNGYFIVKEPRLARLIPLWNHVCKTFGHNVRMIHVWRDPFEVAQSLWRRNNLPIVHGLQLWARYNLDLLRSEVDLQTSTINIRDVVSTPGLLSEACLSLGIQLEHPELLGTVTDPSLLKIQNIEYSDWKLNLQLAETIEKHAIPYDLNALVELYDLCGGDMAAAERRHYAVIHSILWTVVKEFKQLKEGVRRLSETIS